MGGWGERHSAPQSGWRSAALFHVNISRSSDLSRKWFLDTISEETKTILYELFWFISSSITPQVSFLPPFLGLHWEKYVQKEDDEDAIQCSLLRSYARYFVPKRRLMQKRGDLSY
ncbi:hypothetical protein VTI28DRAFT_5335 [Corynascus sepedonium]